MEALDYNDFILKLESHFYEIYKFELLESYYEPYAFGSGYAAYKIKGTVFEFAFDGRDKMISIKKSISHEKYPNCTWSEIYYGAPGALLDKLSKENVLFK